MSEKKRKHREPHDERPRKRSSLDKPSGVLKVNYLPGSKELTPTIVSSPGLSLPSDVQFEPYINRNGKNPELLLHSSAHPSIDFTAREEDDDADTKHFIAIYDPATKGLQLTEAKHLTARATVRRLRTEIHSDSDSASSETVKTPVKTYAARAALTEAFGTKKAKKFYAARHDNALLSQSDNRPASENPLSSALLSSQPLDTLDSEPINDLIQENKPLPRADLTTTDISEVYALRDLIHPPPGLETLFSLPVSDWVNAAKEKKAISAPSKYVANRIAPIAFAAAKVSSKKPSLPLQHLQTLRYILLLLNIHRLATSRSVRYPTLDLRPEKRPRAITEPGTIPQNTLRALEKKYAPNRGKMNNYDITLLRATICALTLHIPPPPGISTSTLEVATSKSDSESSDSESSSHATTSKDNPKKKKNKNKKKPTKIKTTSSYLATNPSDIAHDLALDAGDIRKLYRELGCRFEKPKNEAEAIRWGIKGRSSGVKKEENDGGDGDGGSSANWGRKPKINELAVLRFPVEFAGVSLGRKR